MVNIVSEVTEETRPGCFSLRTTTKGTTKWQTCLHGHTGPASCCQRKRFKEVSDNDSIAVLKTSHLGWEAGATNFAERKYLPLILFFQEINMVDGSHKENKGHSKAVSASARRHVCTHSACPLARSHPLLRVHSYSYVRITTPWLTKLPFERWVREAEGREKEGKLLEWCLSLS